eukprot:TRINITY_DN43698_c0_g1_i1.p1 TRINITY_DN43698_c0_g1~~TRINITY_DN43698_c0_g1_i1.p1  ORF type:complete len:418 (-),score=51.93 TRINITY_DN43698_c0_g1_i1:235-1455(-)
MELLVALVAAFCLWSGSNIVWLFSFGRPRQCQRSMISRRHAPRQCVHPEQLAARADWSSDLPEGAQWLSQSVLSMQFEDVGLAARLGQLCVALEANNCRRTMSNVGGFQSNNLASHVDSALVELMSLMHDPLAAFLRGRLRGCPPQELSSSDSLSIVSRPEHIWANINRPGHHNRLHEHGPPLLCRAASGVYYPKMGKGIADNLDGPPAAVVRLYDGGRLVEVRPKPGLLIMFPTNLLHEVDMSWPGCRPRASIAFNLFVRWLDSPLLRAACDGDCIQVRELSAGSDVDRADGCLGFTPAHVAAEAGHVAVLERLAAQSSDLTKLSCEGWSPLGLSAAQGHLSVVRYLATHEVVETFTRKAADAARDAREVDLTRGFSGLDGALTVASERGHGTVADFLHGLANAD